MRTNILRLVIVSGTVLLLAAACSSRLIHKHNKAVSEDGPVLKVFYPAN